MVLSAWRNVIKQALFIIGCLALISVASKAAVQQVPFDKSWPPGIILKPQLRPPSPLNVNLCEPKSLRDIYELMAGDPSIPPCSNKEGKNQHSRRLSYLYR